MNELHVGFKCELKARSSGCLFITDEVPEKRYRRAKIFNPEEHRFNPLKDITQERAYDLSDVLYTLSPGGDNTLTVRKGRLALAEALSEATRFDRVRSDNEEVENMLQQVLFFDVVKDMICTDKKVFSFNPRNVIYARLNRKELGERVALITGLLLMNVYPGPVVIEDGDFYLRDGHASLIREERLIAKVKVLNSLPKRLREKMLLIETKIAKGCLLEDAELLAQFAGHHPGTDGFSTFVKFATE